MAEAKQLIVRLTYHKTSDPPQLSLRDLFHNLIVPLGFRQLLDRKPFRHPYAFHGFLLHFDRKIGKPPPVVSLTFPTHNQDAHPMRAIFLGLPCIQMGRLARIPRFSPGSR